MSIAHVPVKARFWGWESKALKVPNIDTPHLAPWLWDRRKRRSHEATEGTKSTRGVGVLVGGGHSVVKERAGAALSPAAVE